MLPNKASFLLKTRRLLKIYTTRDLSSTITALFTQHSFTVQRNSVTWMSHKQVLNQLLLLLLQVLAVINF